MKNYLEKCKLIHNNKYDYSLSDFKGLHYKIKIICPDHGPFEQRLDSHLKGSGCKQCYIKKIKFAKYINSTDYHSNLCNLIHENKYDYSLSEFKGLHYKIKIICSKHGIFEQRLDHHKNGKMCPKCKYDERKLTTQEFINKSIEKHGDKYDYSLSEYINHMTKVKIICPTHGIFEQTPNNHLSGSKNEGCCAKCNKRYIYSKDEIIEKANIKHNNKYDYSLIDYKNTKDKVKIICPIHGIFEQNLSQHLYKTGCSKCDKPILNTEHFIELSKAKHNKYDYSLIDFKSTKYKVKIICSIHGIFFQYPLHHIQGCGCPKCSTRSKGEEIIEKFLIENNIDYNTQQTFKNCKYKNLLRFDFYLIKYNICIEYDGELHHKSIKYFGGDNTLKENIIKDNIKNNYCENNNIKLLRIKYTDNIIDKLKTII
jgi:hypothetical protein